MGLHHVEILCTWEPHVTKILIRICQFYYIPQIVVVFFPIINVILLVGTEVM